MTTLVLVGCGGFAGAVARYLVSGWTYGWLGTRLPYGTLAVNVLGSLLLGAVACLGSERLGVVTPEARALVAIGFLGAFTTFSTFSWETFRLLQEGSLWLAAVNIAANVVLCVAAVAAGFLLVRTLL
jgi:CrcB protein